MFRHLLKRSKCTQFACPVNTWSSIYYTNWVLHHNYLMPFWTNLISFYFPNIIVKDLGIHSLWLCVDVISNQCPSQPDTGDPITFTSRFSDRNRWPSKAERVIDADWQTVAHVPDSGRESAWAMSARALSVSTLRSDLRRWLVTTMLLRHATRLPPEHCSRCHWFLL